MAPLAAAIVSDPRTLAPAPVEHELAQASSDWIDLAYPPVSSQFLLFASQEWGGKTSATIPIPSNAAGPHPCAPRPDVSPTWSRRRS